MPRILSDPSLIECPDYASDDHAAVRAPFINPNTTEEQAIQLLTNFWKAGNDSDRLKWVRQVEQDAEEVAERERLRTEAEATAARAQQVEVAAARMEEMKKNKSKYLPIPDRDVPTIAPVIAANYAIRRMEQGLYVDMYYYTNAGLRDALRDSGAVDDEAMVMLRQPNGGTGWTPAAAVRDSRSVVDDKDIAWEDFCQAAPRMIIAMEQAGWREERVRMLASFWGTLFIRRNSESSGIWPLPHQEEATTSRESTVM
ncbi:hypothetical protein JAAARDRAFT_543284 [Jaapia argillacea MUCL 33604]|uniref:Uncharacterized protein n=1 Tax=Jaapia argillacea MUCL 33604 TaxID=933084 RepID=A0A067P885_9AGAM|nr:hypothetical protein JAAARDRAFT_543284 [Jaapia argillacea MUCL 33604]